MRLFTRHDWSARYPLIVEAALCDRQTSFVIDGEAVSLGVDGISDFNAPHSRKHDEEVQLYAFNVPGACGRRFARAAASPAQEQSRVAAGAADNVEIIDLRGSRRIGRAWQVRNVIDAGRWFVLLFYCNFADGKEAP